jgi:syndecan 4
MEIFSKALTIWTVLGFSSPSGRQSKNHFGKNKHKNLSSLSAAPTDASPGAPPRLGELWVTDPTTDSLRLSWTVPEGHFDSFVVQFKDKNGPQVVPVEGNERSATIAPLDSGRRYRFLLYGLLGKKRIGPLTADGTTGRNYSLQVTALLL